MFVSIVFLLVALVGCEVPPRFVETTAEVDGFLVRSAYRSACVGLHAREADVREYTARRLAEYGHVSAINECLCSALYDDEAGEWDEAVARGLASTERDDLAECLLPALDDERLTEQRLALVRALGAMEAPAAYAALTAVASSDEPSDIRIAAAASLRGSKASVSTLIKLLETDPDPEVRGAGAEGLAGRPDKAVRMSLRKVMASDEDGTVRAAAVRALARGSGADDDKAMCEVLGKDEDPNVQSAIVGAWAGTKRKANLDCIDDLIGRGSLEGSVRVAVLDTLTKSPSKFAADMLCKHISGWVRAYIVDKIFHDIAGSDIVKAQNDRDYERSYECVAQALRKGGYSCYGKNYLGHWMRELGGQAPTPWCPGMVRN